MSLSTRTEAIIVAVICFLKLACLSDIYTDTWAVHAEGGPEAAQKLAEQHGFEFVNTIMTDYYLLRHHKVMKRSVDRHDQYHELLESDTRVKWVEQQMVKRRVKRDKTLFNDPKWPLMWYLNRGAGLDMNVIESYTKFNITGRGIVVSILDDGIEKDHPDLIKNYDADASYDVNGHDNDPQPRYDITNENRHGTRCAGEVAAAANNHICSVGIAYDAGIGGVRMLDGDVTDAVEAQSISLNPQHIHIYSASWGPDDDGRTVDGPGPLARKAFIDGIKQGRGGLGSIYVWASGNGGQQGDSCNCDGYTNSMFTLSISSASENGLVPWYSEACSSTLATTYSSGQGSEKQIITTDLRKQCTESHTGTSASAPLAAGVCALALQANPQLTWRDLQHIVVCTAKRNNLKADDWVTNGAGREVSHHFGFGLMDSSGMVELAMRWQTVPEQRKCCVKFPNFEAKNVPVNGNVESELESNGCLGSENEIQYLEHVEAVVTLSTSVRGQVQVFLTSPSGTKSTLLAVRSHDTSSEGFNQWPFMTTHNWGENPSGKWKLEVQNRASVAVLKEWTLCLLGTLENPLNVAMTTRGLFSETLQTWCKNGEYLLNGNCYKSCPKGFHADNETVAMDYVTTAPTVGLVRGVCRPCHESCMACKGSKNTDCLNCADSFELDSKGQCIKLSKPKARGDKRFNLVGKLALILVSIFSFVMTVLLLICIILRVCTTTTSSYKGKDITGGLEQGMSRPLLQAGHDDEDIMQQSSKIYHDEDDSYRHISNGKLGSDVAKQHAATNDKILLNGVTDLNNKEEFSQQPGGVS